MVRAEGALAGVGCDRKGTIAGGERVVTLVLEREGDSAVTE